MTFGMPYQKGKLTSRDERAVLEYFMAIVQG
jgi:hypothetical protein